MTNPLPLKLRVAAAALALAPAAPVAALIHWMWRTTLRELDTPAVDDGGTGLVIVTAVVAATAIGGGIAWFIVSTAHAFVERLLPRFLSWRARVRTAALVRLKMEEDRRIVEELHTAEASRQLLQISLADIRAKAQADRDLWHNLARDQRDELIEPGRNLGIFERYATASLYHRMLIREGYAQQLELAHPRHEFHTALAIADLPPLARLLYLPIAIEATDGPMSYDRLDFDLTDHPRRRYVYRSNRRVPDFEHWCSQLPAIQSYLGGRWQISRGAGAYVVLTRLPDIAPAFPLDRSLLKPGQIYLGQDLNTGGPVHVGLDRLSHTLVAGPTGMGKSVALHTLMASVITNHDLFEAVHLVDLKYGLELQDYATLSPKFQLTASQVEVGPLVSALIAEMDRRGRLMRDARRQRWTGPLILVIIDEFADVLLAETDKKKRDALETGLIRLTNLSRALGFRFWVQSQKTTADALPTPIRTNLQSILSFRIATNQAAAMLLGGTEDLPADITKLNPGQAIYRDGITSETVALQGPLVTFAEVAQLMPGAPLHA